MSNDISTVERALELARMGACRSVSDIRQQLTRERFPSVPGHLSSGSMLVRQLQRLLADRSKLGEA